TMIAELPTSMEKLLSKVPERKQRYFKQAIKIGLEFYPGGVDEVDEFYEVLISNRSKFNAVPTHTMSDLKYLLMNCASAVKIFVTRHNQKAIAGGVVFELTPHVAYLFYLCHVEEGEVLRASLFTTLKIQEYYISRGFKYFDLGPSTFDDGRVNAGGIQFKEE